MDLNLNKFSFFFKKKKRRFKKIINLVHQTKEWKQKSIFILLDQSQTEKRLKKACPYPINQANTLFNID